MITEQQSLQLENIEADKQFWSWLRDGCEEEIKGKKTLAAKLEREIAEAQSRADQAGENVAVAQSRIERLQKGESVEGGINKLTAKDMTAILMEMGWSTRDIRHAQQLSQLDEAEFRQYINELRDEDEETRRDRAVLRRLLRRRGEVSGPAVSSSLATASTSGGLIEG